MKKVCFYFLFFTSVENDKIGHQARCMSEFGIINIMHKAGHAVSMPINTDQCRIKFVA